MTAADLIDQLRAAGHTVRADGGRILVGGAVGLSVEFAAALAARRSVVLAILEGRQAPCPRCGQSMRSYAGRQVWHCYSCDIGICAGCGGVTPAAWQNHCGRC